MMKKNKQIRLMKKPKEMIRAKRQEKKLLKMRNKKSKGRKAVKKSDNLSIGMIHKLKKKKQEIKEKQKI
jgi:hypothetical protein